eukprot:5348081-Amphidinium_carterae.1
MYIKGLSVATMTSVRVGAYGVWETSSLEPISDPRFQGVHWIAKQVVHVPCVLGLWSVSFDITFLPLHIRVLPHESQSFLHLQPSPVQSPNNPAHHSN